MNLIHMTDCDGTNPDDLTTFEIEGRRQAMMAIDAMRRHTPGCDGARLRNFGMTIGIRDTRKIDAQYNMTAQDVREQGRFDDAIGIFPEFIDGYGVLILPHHGALFSGALSHLAAEEGEKLVCGGACHRRRRHQPCGDAQHGLLCGHGPGRGYRCGGISCLKPRA